MSPQVTVALIELAGQALWPAVTVFLIIFVVRALNSGALVKIFPDGGTISFGDAKLEVRKAVDVAGKAIDEIPGISKTFTINADDKAVDAELDPYDLVMKTWYELSDAITNLSVRHGGLNDRRQVWTNIESLVGHGQITESEKGAVRDLQKARNSIRRLQEVDRESAEKFSENARRLSELFRSKE